MTNNNEYKNRKGKIGDRFRKRTVINSNQKAKKEYTKILIFVALLGIITLGTSYALFTFTVSSDKTTVIKAGHFQIDYADGNKVVLENEVPKTDSQGLNNKAYEFTITNNGNVDSNYNVSLEEGVVDANTLNRGLIKYSIRENNGSWSDPTTLPSNLLLVPNKALDAGENVNYSLVFWLDYNADNTVQGKSYSAKIVVNAVQKSKTSEMFNAPVITLNGDTIMNVDKGESFTDPGVLNVEDYNGDDLSKDSIQISYRYFNGTSTTNVSSVDTTKVGSYFITYTINSPSGGQNGIITRTINVNDTTTTSDSVPIISLVGDATTYVEKGSTYVDKGATAIDTEDGDITKNIITEGVVNTNKLGSYEIKYLIEDSAHHIVSAIREVVVAERLNDDGTVSTDNPITITVGTLNKKDKSVEIPVTFKTKKGNIIGYNITKGDADETQIKYTKVNGTDEYTKTFTVNENGTYYVWGLDSNQNKQKQTVEVTELDKVRPVCTISAPEYGMVNNDTEINVSCYDDIALKDSTIEKSDFTFDKSDVTIKNLELVSSNENSVQYKLIVVSTVDQDVTMTLKPAVSDKNGNYNKKKEETITFSEDTVQKHVTVDLSTNPTKKIEVNSHVGTLVFNSNDTSIATVDQDGNVTGVSVGETRVTVKDMGTNLTSETTVTVNKTLTATYTKSGSGVDSIATTTEVNTQCVVTPSSSGRCQVTMPEFSSLNGYTVVGWNTDSSAHTATAIAAKVAITDNTEFFTITKKNAITVSVNFDSNGAESISSNTKSCTIDAVYNNEEQATTCEITAPTITASSNTPIVVGWNSDSTGTNKEFASGEIVNLDSNKNGNTYYAITKNEAKTYTATYETNGFGVESIPALTTDNTTCLIPSTYNGESQKTSCTVTAPVINIKSGYTAIGWNTDKDSHTSLVESDTLTLDSNKTYYTITKLNGKVLTATYEKIGDGVETISATTDTCETTDVYNPTEELDNTCTISPLPTITVSDGYTALGWDSDRTSHLPKYSQNGSITLGENITLYTISRKNEITYTATFNINGAGTQTNSEGDAVSTDVTRSCRIADSYNEDTQQATCNITTPTITGSTNTPDVIGYNTDSDATVSTVNINTEISLSSNVTYYAITKKPSVSLNATFDANSATLSTTNDASCSLIATYNGTQQQESCTVDAPVITGSSNTPDVIGYSLSMDNHENNSAYNSSNGTLTLTSENTGKVWYAQTEAKAKTYTVNNFAKGTNVSAVSDSSPKSCTIAKTYNGVGQDTTCSITPPDYTVAAGYTKVGWTKSETSADGATNIIVLTGNVDAYYAHASANSYTIEYYDGETLKGSISASVGSNITLSTKAELGLSNAGYTFKGWSTDKSQTVTYTDGQNVSNLSTNEGDVVKIYAVWVDDIKPVCTFTSAPASITGSTTTIDLNCIDEGSKIVSRSLSETNFTLSNGNASIDSVSSATAIENGYKYTITLRGVSVGTYTLSLNAGTISDNASNANELTESGELENRGITYTATFTKGDNVDDIGATSKSCTTTGSATTCSITLPSITLATGYIGEEWYVSDTLAGVPDDSYVLSSDTTFVSKGTRATASLIQYSDTYNIGCTDVQCAINKINDILS